MKKFRFLFLLTIIGLSLSLAATARAATKTWNGSTDKNAATPANWTGGVVPVSGDALVFPSGNVNWNLAGIVPASVSTAAQVVLNQPLIVSGSLAITGGAIDLNGQPLNVGGDLNIAGDMLTGASSINLSGNWNYSAGNLTLDATPVIFNGTGAKTIVSGGKAFGTLTVAADNGTVRASDNLLVNNGFSLTGGTFDLNGRTLAVYNGINISGGTFGAGSGKVVLAGTTGRPFAVSGGTVNLEAATVEYKTVTGSVSVEPLTYGNLNFTGQALFSLAGNAVVRNSMTVGTDATFSPGAYMLEVPNGNLENSGTITDGTIKCPALALALVGADGKEVGAVKSTSGTVYVTVEDRNLNRKGAVRDVVPAAVVVTTMGGDREVIGIEETDLKSGRFKSGPLVLHAGEAKTANGQIELGQNDMIFVTYTDPQDTSDKRTIQAAVAAAATTSKGMPQIVSGPRLENWSSVNSGSEVVYSAHVVWETDILSTSAVAITSPQLTTPLTAGSLAGVTTHDVAVTGLKRGQTYTFTVSSLSADGQSVTSKAKKFVVIVPGDRLKTAASSAVYWYLDGKRAVFSDPTTYDSWFTGFSGIVTVPAEQLSDIMLGKAVPVRGGTYLVKIQSDPKTYAVEPGGRLRWIPTEAIALALYGKDWSKRVRDVDVAQFVNYSAGEPLKTGEAPSGFAYRVSGSELGVVVGNTARQLTEAARQANGINERFVSAIAPVVINNLSTSSPVVSFENDLNTVLGDGAKALFAPATSVANN